MEIKSRDLEYIEHSELRKGIVRNLFIVNTNWGFASLYKCDGILVVYTAHFPNCSTYQIFTDAKYPVHL